MTVVLSLVVSEEAGGMTSEWVVGGCVVVNGSVAVVVSIGDTARGVTGGL